MNEPLPDLQNALVDAQTVRELGRDLEALTRVVDVRTRQRTRARPDAVRWKPSEALEGLLEGTLQAVQISYTFDGEQWRDTVMRQDQGYRLVRMQLPASACGSVAPQG